MTFETIRAMLIGYARVSTQEQTLDLQKDALEKIGRIKIFSDVVSGAKAERTGITEALEYVREGDTLVVWRLDRLGRSLKDLNRGREKPPTSPLPHHPAYGSVPRRFRVLSPCGQ